MRHALALPVLLVALALPVAQPGAGGPSPTSPLHSWHLLFVRGSDIWLARGDGTGQRRLIRNADAPCWSPDRTRIAFARDGNVWIARSDGTSQHPLTHRWGASDPVEKLDDAFDGGTAIDISWDPRDNLVTFSHWERFRVSRVGATESHVIAAMSLYDVPARSPRPDECVPRFDLLDIEARFHPSVNGCPAWSKSGRYLAFVRNGDVWVAERVDRRDWAEPHRRTWRRWGWEVRRLEAAADYDAPTWRGSRENLYVTRLSWSPNEKWLVYGQTRVNGSGYEYIDLLRVREIYGVAQVVGRRHLCGGLDPCFSPDGKWIAYHASGMAGHVSGIHVRSLDGKVVRQIVDDGYQPTW